MGCSLRDLYWNFDYINNKKKLSFLIYMMKKYWCYFIEFLFSKMD